MAHQEYHSPQFGRASGYSSGLSEPDTLVQRMSPEEQETARKAAQFGWGPLAGPPTHSPRPFSMMHPAFTSGDVQRGPVDNGGHRKFGNPSPLGLSAFALTTFLFSLINLGTRHISIPSIVIGPALGYGGLVQLLTGMWELALGNTFAATALSSFGGFWISTAIILTPGGFNIQASYPAGGYPDGFEQAFALYFFAWTIFIFFLLLGTVKTNVAYFSLFLMLDLTFLFLACAYQNSDSQNTKPNTGLLRAGGTFGALTAFISWYNAMAGLLDSSNSFFTLPLFEFPWSAEKEQQKELTASSNGTSRKA